MYPSLNILHFPQLDGFLRAVIMASTQCGLRKCVLNEQCDRAAGTQKTEVRVSNYADTKCRLGLCLVFPKWVSASSGQSSPLFFTVSEAGLEAGDMQ